MNPFSRVPTAAAIRQPVPRRRRGVSMIEVLVVLVLFSFGLLGLVGLQARATQITVNVDDSNVAALLANELAATMWNNQSNDLDAAIVEAWQARVADPVNGGLPNGEGVVELDGNVARITISWSPPGMADGASYRYVTEVLIP